MTIYDLTRALRRYRRSILIAFTLLIVAILVMTFRIQDGKLSFRAGLTYESSVQIAVVAPGMDSLISPSGSTDFAGEASVYASLLGSDEAAKWIGDRNGYTLEAPVDASTERSSPIINTRVEGPTPEQAKAAALSTFDWLAEKLLEPVATADFPSPPTTIPVVYLDSSFTSFTNIDVSADIGSLPDDLFVFVTINESSPIAFPLKQSAGDTIRARAVLDPLSSVVITLSTNSDEVLDTLRLAPGPAPTIVEAVPELGISLTRDSFDRITLEDETRTWVLVGSEIELVWQEGTIAALPEVVDTVTVDLALLTPDPGFTSTGGRRGPITAIALFIIGSVLILTFVIVADTWRRERDAHHVSDAASHGPGMNHHGPPNGVTNVGVGEVTTPLTDIEVHRTSTDS